MCKNERLKQVLLVPLVELDYLAPLVLLDYLVLLVPPVINSKVFYS